MKSVLQWSISLVVTNFYGPPWVNNMCTDIGYSVQCNVVPSKSDLKSDESKSSKQTTQRGEKHQKQQHCKVTNILCLLINLVKIDLASLCSEASSISESQVNSLHDK